LVVLATNTDTESAQRVVTSLLTTIEKSESHSQLEVLEDGLVAFATNTVQIVNIVLCVMEKIDA